MKTEAETEVRPLPVKEYQGLPVSTRSWARGLEQTLPKHLQKERSLPQAWLCTSSLRNHEKRRFDGFKSGLMQHYLHDSVTWGDLNQKVMPSDPSNLRWLLRLLMPGAALLTPYNQMHEESASCHIGCEPREGSMFAAGTWHFLRKTWEGASTRCRVPWVCRRSDSVPGSWPSRHHSLRLHVPHWTLNEHQASSKESLTLLLDNHWSCVGETQVR